MPGGGGSGSKRAREDRFPDPGAWPELLAALDWLPLAALVLAADASAVAVNRGWVVLSAMARGDSLGEGWLTAMEPVDRATLRSRLRGAAARGETGTGQSRLATPAARGWSRWWWRPGPGGRLVVCVAETGGHEPGGDDRWPGAAHGSPARLVPRSEFVNLAGRALRRRKWTGTAVAVVVAGIEAITATGGPGGQPASDQVPRAVGERILGAVGPADVAALVGSSEFAILCGDLRDPEQAGIVARRIGDALTQPVEAGAVSFSAVTATGIAVASAPGDTAETLISAARRAMRATQGTQAAGPQASPPASPASAVAYPQPGRGDESQPACDRPAQQASPAQADHGLDAVSVLDSVVAHAFRAGLTLQGVRPGGLEAAAGVDHALGQLDEIVRQVCDLAFQLRGPGTRIRRLGPDGTGRSGT